MEREINEEKRQKFIEYAGKRVNNVLHDIQILEPMARSNTYDFTRKDVEDMFSAMQETLNEAKEEFNRKFDEKARAEKKTFSFATTGDVTVENHNIVTPTVETTTAETIIDEAIVDTVTNITETTYNTDTEISTTEVEL